MASVAVKLKQMQSQVAALNQMKTKGDVKNTAIKTTVETLLSVLVGGGLGALIGRPSFLLGLGATAIGNYTGQGWLTPIGIGMMTSSTFGSNQRTVGALDLKGQMQNAKERLTSFKDSLMHRTYLDKVIKPKSGGTEETSGFGSIEANNDALREVEEQLVNSAREFRRERGESTSGLEGNMQGMDEPDFSGM